MGRAVVVLTVEQNVSCTCRSEPARDGPENAAGRQVPRVIVDDHREQGPDHPVHPAIPETRYIKSITCRLLPNS